jgi:hypothetical protein
MSAAIQQVADQARGIPLAELLRWHGFKMTKEGASIRARSGHHNIVVTGNKWFDNKAGSGGAGAIDLQMHLCGGDFQTACHVLAEGYRPVDSGLAFPLGKRPEDRRRPFEELAAQYAVPSTGNWPMARDYLVETRKIDASLVDELHEKGVIYANNHRPNPGIVFLHQTLDGKVAGATLRDSRHESSFRPCLGNKVSAWFSVGDLANAHTIVAVESPIDALSYHSLFIGRDRGHTVVSCSGSNVPDDLMWAAYDRRQKFIVALDNDSAGELGWQKAWDSTTEWTGFDISSECPRRKDWNDDLVASVRQAANVQKPAAIRL